jgi:hypothetical protein
VEVRGGNVTVLVAPLARQPLEGDFSATERPVNVSERSTDNNIKNHFYSTLRRSLRRLNKVIGEKNSTLHMREIKPSVLTIILNFIYDHQE